MLLLILLFAFPRSAFAASPDQGVLPDRIVIGMSTVLSGPSASLGQEMKKGIDAHLAELNAAGGVHGRIIVLEAIDDGYEPSRTAPAMRELIERKKAFAIVGNVGTPTAVVAVPIANELKTPFFGAFTGAGLLRKTPPDRYVINVRASYAEETAEVIEGLVSKAGIPPERIAFFTQNDAYGDSGYKGGIVALQKLGVKDTARLVHGRYQRNTTNVEDGLSRILEARKTPRAVIMVGAYKACARFIELARREGLNALFINVSFVGPEALARELGPVNREGVIVTQVIPPLDADLPGVAAYHKAMGSEARSSGSLEGYVVARALAEGLKRAGANPTREGFIDVLEASRDIDLGLGMKHALSATEHQLSHKVWPTIMVNGNYRSLDWRALKTMKIVQR